MNENQNKVILLNMENNKFREYAARKVKEAVNALNKTSDFKSREALKHINKAVDLLPHTPKCKYCKCDVLDGPHIICSECEMKNNPFM